MNNAKKCLVSAILFLGVLAGVSFAGDLNAPAAPTDAASAMFTLEDLYNRLASGLVRTKRSGAFAEPSTGPGSTMHNLNDIMSRAPAVDIAGAAPGDVLSGKKYWGLTSGQWGFQTGTLPTGTLSATSKVVHGGFIATTTLDAIDADLAVGNIKAGATIFGVAGKPEVVDTTGGDAVAADLRSGKTAYVDGAEVTGTVSVGAANTNGADGAKVITIPAGIYAGTETTTAVDSALIPGNIKEGTTIFGVAGTSLSSSIQKTGQTTSYFPGDDGDLKKGIAWPTPRFTDHGNGTVTDRLTGLIWLKNGFPILTDRSLADTMSELTNLNTTGWMNGQDAGDTSNAGNHQTDWRLPNLHELRSLIDVSQFDPALPAGHPFTFGGGPAPSQYWTSTTFVNDSTRVWIVSLADGGVTTYAKTATCCLWPVRGGQ